MPDKEELFQLVVIGSSAGGIEALSTLLKTLPSQFPLPIVIAQHLDPTRPSHLPEILSRLLLFLFSLERFPVLLLNQR